jgi:hypothetical protein
LTWPAAAADTAPHKPSYRIYYKEHFEADQGEWQQWELPWLRLVFDQRFDATPPGKTAPGRYQVLDVKRDAKGEYFVVSPQVVDAKGAR